MSIPIDPAPQTAPPREGVVVVVQHATRFLMIQRAEGILAAGAWCFVGGGIEPGELQPEAVRREFREELGGEVEPDRKIWDWTRPDGRLRLHWWHAHLLRDGFVPNPAEVAAFGWFNLPQISALPNVLESNIEFLAVWGARLAAGALVPQDPPRRDEPADA